MTDGIHDNLDKNPAENEKIEAADARKLETLQKFSKDDDIGTADLTLALRLKEKT